MSGTTVTVYANGYVSRVVDTFGNITGYGYDTTTGLRVTVTNALGKVIRFEHDAQGQPLHQWGDATYPVSYTYDEHGRMESMTTYRGSDIFTNATWPASATGDTMRWSYLPSGHVQSKSYGDETGRLNVYDPAGRILETISPPSRTVFYGYDGAGRLTSVTYGDATNPAISYTYFRHGGPNQIMDASGTRTFTYHADLQVASETLTASNGFAPWFLSRSFESSSGQKGHPTVLELSDTNLTASLGYGYDVYGRLNQVTSGAVRVSYQYQTNSPWVQAADMYHSNQWRFSHVSQRDGGGRVTNAVNNLVGDPAEWYGYGHDAAGRRTWIGRTDGSAWSNVYNGRGEVVLSQRKWEDSTPVGGQRFEYAYDPIGNRLTSRRETNDPQVTWMANSLNQYLTNTVAGVLHVVGEGRTNATVTMTGSVAGAASISRRGRYFQGKLVEPNTVAPVWETVKVSASYTGSVTTVTGRLFLAMTPQTFTYDAGGNLTSDGRWNYSWDMENRLTGMVTRVAGVASQRLAFAYDYMGRRVRKVVDVASGTNWVNELTAHFAYDGWNLVRETRQTNGAVPQVLTHVWGLDLSGSPQGAGGVGGLLATIPGGGSGPLLFGRDANGNVVLAVAATNGAVTANYEYGPFGEPLRTSGPMAEANPFRFSTHYCDDETGLLYAKHRYYSPSIGRWLSRDPIGEVATRNLYAYVFNDPISFVDALGLWGSAVHNGMTVRWAGYEGYSSRSAQLVGTKDEAVDGGWSGSGTGWAPWGDQSYHFNTSGAVGGSDTRLAHKRDHTQKAKKACSVAHDNYEEAAEHMGLSLHALQDWWAHGDHNSGGSSFGAHNTGGPVSPDARTGDSPDDYPDAVYLDAKDTPDGRAAGAYVIGGNGVAYYVTGIKRIQSTGTQSRQILREFIDYIQEGGGCKCRAFFLSDQGHAL